MRSHDYEISLRQLGRALLPTMVVLSALLVLFSFGRQVKLMPAPATALDPNSALLAHQSRAAVRRGSARIILIGDSTCLVGVDAAALERQLKTPVLNLALLSWFDLRDYGQLAAEFARANPGQVKAVVLLVTPEKLGMKRGEGEEELWQEIRSNRQMQGQGAQHLAARGLRVLRENLVGYVLSTPLRQSAAADRFGFAPEIDTYMKRHNGSSLDFGYVKKPKSSFQHNWKFAPDMKAQSSGLRAEMPAGAQLIVGFTPEAQSYCGQNDSQRELQELKAWNAWLHADRVLTNLPSSLPDVLFASKAHLNEMGQERFTKMLGEELAESVRR